MNDSDRCFTHVNLRTPLMLERKSMERNELWTRRCGGNLSLQRGSCHEMLIKNDHILFKRVFVFTKWLYEFRFCLTMQCLYSIALSGAQ